MTVFVNETAVSVDEYYKAHNYSGPLPTNPTMAGADLRAAAGRDAMSVLRRTCETGHCLVGEDIRMGEAVLLHEGMKFAAYPPGAYGSLAKGAR